MKTAVTSVVGLFAVFASALGSEPVVVHVELAAAAARHAGDRARFAESVPHAASAARDGAWTREADAAVWRYAVRVPGARSLSLHAATASLPAGTRLLIGGREHGRADIGPSGLWSRPVAGDLLEIEARVPQSARNEFSFAISALQAGFRDWGAGVKVRPNTIPGSKAATDADNYACYGGYTQSRAVLHILVANVGACTATLVNNEAADRRMLVLTAQHCGVMIPDPAAAAATRAYFNEITPCGTELGMAGDGPSTLGALHRANWKDVWLIELLNPAPEGVTPFWAGFDATDALVGGAFSINHAGGRDQQFYVSSRPPTKNEAGLQLSWEPEFAQQWHSYGASYAVLEGGSSGSALFSDEGNVMGVLNTAFSTCEDPECGVYDRLAETWSNGLPVNSLQPWLAPSDPDGRKVPGLDSSPSGLVALDGAGRAASGSGGAFGGAIVVLVLVALRRRHAG